METTARLQGVCLGKHLVLLDTPGLHSVTPENAALTQRFTECADAVLWLTSSTSPGQVQELDDLSRELRRGKPLLPIITRSDVIEEDEAEGEIVKRLRNKNPANRLLQESDVRKRGLAKLHQMGVEECWLKTPVSVSVHMAREAGESAQALADSGFAQLCAALFALVDPARAYKQRKPAEVMLHHLEENVRGTIDSHIQAGLSQLVSLLREERARLQTQQPRLIRGLQREVLPVLPKLLERHTPLHDGAGLCQAFGEVLHDALAHQVEQHIGDHEVCTASARGSVQIGLPDHSGYAQLYEALAERAQQLIAQQVEGVIGQCCRGLDALELPVLALQALLAGQHDRLEHIKCHLRGCAVLQEVGAGLS